MFFDKPESKSKVQAQSQIEKGKRKKDFGPWAVSKILWATTPPITFKHKEGL